MKWLCSARVWSEKLLYLSYIYLFRASSHRELLSELKIWSSGVSPKKASKMQLRDVDLRFVGHSSQDLWPKTLNKYTNTASFLTKNEMLKKHFSEGFHFDTYAHWRLKALKWDYNILLKPFWNTCAIKYQYCQESLQYISNYTGCPKNGFSNSFF